MYASRAEPHSVHLSPHTTTAKSHPPEHRAAQSDRFAYQSETLAACKYLFHNHIIGTGTKCANHSQLCPSGWVYAINRLKDAPATSLSSAAEPNGQPHCLPCALFFSKCIVSICTIAIPAADLKSGGSYTPPWCRSSQCGLRHIFRILLPHRERVTGTLKTRSRDQSDSSVTVGRDDKRGQRAVNI